MQISYTASELYKSCPKKYYYRYIENLVPKEYAGPLIFGTAIDQALSLLLLTKKTSRTIEEDILIKSLTDIKLYQSFDNSFAFQKPFIESVNDKGNSEAKIDIRHDHLCEYFNGDFDYRLLHQEDIKVLNKYIKAAGYTQTNIEALFDIISEEKKKSLVDKEFYNYCCFLSLRRKGHALIKQFKLDIMPKIDEVYDIQRKVKITNDSGDTLSGAIDVILKLNGEDFKRIIDLKTSSKSYPLNKIDKEGEQLAIYAEMQNIKDVGYFILIKKPDYIADYKECISCNKREINLKKRKCECGDILINQNVNPIFKCQILLGNIKDEQIDLTFDTLSSILINIEKKEFPCKKENCFSFGRKCSYYDFCEKR